MEDSCTNFRGPITNDERWCRDRFTNDELYRALYEMKTGTSLGFLGLDMGVLHPIFANPKFAVIICSLLN